MVDSEGFGENIQETNTSNVVLRNLNDFQRSVAEIFYRHSDPLPNKRAATDSPIWYVEQMYKTTNDDDKETIPTATADAIKCENMLNVSTDSSSDSIPLKSTRQAGVYTESSDSEDSKGFDALSFPPKCTTSHTEGKVVANFTIQSDVYSIFSALYTKSDFITEFMSTRRIIDLCLGDWQETGEEAIRTNKYIVKLTQPIGPKQVHVTEKQTLLPESKPGYLYAINVETNNSGAPHAESFYLDNHICLTRVSEKESTLFVTLQIKFRKSVWGPMRSLIERTTMSTTLEYYAALEIRLKNEFRSTILPTQNISVKSSSNTMQSVAKRPLRIKGPAPSVPKNNDCKKTGYFTFNHWNKTTKFNYPICESLLKILIFVLAGSLLIFNFALFLKVQNLEAAIDDYPVNYESELLTLTRVANQEDWVNLLRERQKLLEVQQSKWYDSITDALEVLELAERKLLVLKSLLTNYEEQIIQSPNMSNV